MYLHQNRIAFVANALLALTLSLGLLEAQALAETTTLEATAVGYIRRSPGGAYQHHPQEGHLTGSQGNGILHTDNNSYFVFDLSGVSGVVTAATFRVYTSNPRDDFPQGGYWSSDPTEELRLRHVATPASTLSGYPSDPYSVGTPQYAELDAMFTDLGAGSLFGSTTFNEADAEAVPGAVTGQPGGKMWDVPLNALAVASLNDVAGAWAVGGALADVAPPISTTTELLFRGSVPFSTIPGRATPKPQLVLTTSPPSADFDDDGVVDGADFLRWQRGVGLTGQTDNSNGDASGNGVVAAEDLSIWMDQFGTAGVSSAGVAVAEPASLTLLLAAVAATSAVAKLHWHRSTNKA